MFPPPRGALDRVVQRLNRRRFCVECMKSLLVGKSIQDVKKYEELSRSAIDFFG